MSDATAIVNDALNQLRDRERLTEGALARRLDVDPATLWRWRQGEFGKAVAILIPLVVETARELSDRAA